LAFQADLFLPVPNQVYDNELKGWNGESIIWSEFETHLISGDESMSSFYDITLFIASVNLLYTVIRTRAVMNQSVIKSIDDRLLKLNQIVGLQETDEYNATANIALYATAVLLYQNTANTFLIATTTDEYNIRPMNPNLVYKYKPYTEIIASLQRMKTDSEFKIAVERVKWASHGLTQVLVPSREVMEMSSIGVEEYSITNTLDDLFIPPDLEETWTSLPDYIATCLEFALAVALSELIILHYYETRESLDGNEEIVASIRKNYTIQSLTNELRYCVKYAQHVKKYWPGLRFSFKKCFWVCKKAELEIKAIRKLK
jgi:hypothetical protein